MAILTSKKVKLGSKASDFVLLDSVSNKKFSLQDLKGEIATVIMFICNHCPFVKHVRSELSELAKEYQPKGIGFAAISANDVKKYPQDGLKYMKEFAQENDFIFPYLFDEAQDIVKNYDAACTPDFFVYDKNLKLIYHGQLDDSTPHNNLPVTGSDLRAVLEAILDNLSVPIVQKPSRGCAIAWKD